MAGDAQTEERLNSLTRRVNELSEEMAKIGPALEKLAEETSALRTELREEIGGLRTELREETRAWREEMTAERDAAREGVQALRDELHNGLNGVRSDFQTEIRAVRGDLSAFQRQALALSVTLIGVLIAGIITLVIALH